MSASTGRAQYRAPVPDACWFLPLSDSDTRFRATADTAGPWSPHAQHGGPPAALLTRALERCSPREEMLLSRITMEILGPVPVEEMTVQARVARAGRRVERLEAVLSAAGRPVMTAAAWRVLRTGLGAPAADVSLPPLPEQATDPAEFSSAGYLQSMEWRIVSGGWTTPGPAAVWTRMRGALVAGEEPSGLQRLMGVADSGNGVSAVLDLSRFWFINPELTVHVHREPAGEWLLLDAQTTISAGGTGLATSVLSDQQGPVGRGAQSLLVGER